MAPLPSGVVVSYFTGAKESGAGIITILAEEDYGYKEASVGRRNWDLSEHISFQRTPKTILKKY
jgi:hypothetical protein